LAAELMSARARAPGLEPYVRHCVTPESPAPAALTRLTNAHDWDRRTGPGAVTALEQLAADREAFDFVFVDADKAGYLEYVMTVLDRRLLAPDGVICVDNTLLQGEPYLPGERSDNGAAIAAFNEAIVRDPRVEQVLPPVSPARFSATGTGSSSSRRRDTC
jgi:predicted O-methyltransferase YrrM